MRFRLAAFIDDENVSHGKLALTQTSPHDSHKDRIWFKWGPRLDSTGFTNTLLVSYMHATTDNRQPTTAAYGYTFGGSPINVDAPSWRVDVVPSVCVNAQPFFIIAHDCCCCCCCRKTNYSDLTKKIPSLGPPPFKSPRKMDAKTPFFVSSTVIYCTVLYCTLHGKNWKKSFISDAKRRIFQYILQLKPLKVILYGRPSFQRPIPSLFSLPSGAHQASQRQAKPSQAKPCHANDP